MQSAMKGGQMQRHLFSTPVNSVAGSWTRVAHQRSRKCYVTTAAVSGTERAQRGISTRWQQSGSQKLEERRHGESLKLLTIQQLADGLFTSPGWLYCSYCRWLWPGAAGDEGQGVGVGCFALGSHAGLLSQGCTTLSAWWQQGTVPCPCEHTAFRTYSPAHTAP